MKTVSLSALVALVASAVGLAAQPSEIPAPAAVARSIQARYDRIRDFSAGFTHTYVGGVLRKRLVERGTLQVKRPGRMRWVYSWPEEKVFVSDGTQVYSYMPADRQVYVSPMPPEDQATTAALFLSGKGKLDRDFEAAFDDTAKAAPDVYALRLTPREAERDYDWLTLVVDRASLRIRSLVAADRQGGTSTFAFANLKENTGLADSLFVFKIPRGVDVIRTSPPR
jgi:outer membrane lipoprotein carrier protein